jgi:hypothetical protein
VATSLNTGLAWPYTLTVTIVSGVFVGLVEGALLRSPVRPIAGYVAMMCFSSAAMGMPLLILTYGDDVTPSSSGADLAVAVIIFGLFWLAMTATALLMFTVKRTRQLATTDRSAT